MTHRDRPMGWTPILVMRVQHGYFAHHQPQHLRLVATAETAQFIRRHLLLERSQAGELWLHAPSDRFEPLWSERLVNAQPRTLRWNIISDDPDYGLYTDRRAPTWVEAPLVLPSVDSPEGWQKAQPQHLEYAIQPRQLTWKYLLLGDWQTDQPALSLTESAKTDFRHDEDEILPNGQRARVFRSSHRLPMGLTGPQRIALLDMGCRTPRVLQARMPLAAPRGLCLEKRHGRTRPVCEIFVHP